MNSFHFRERGGGPNFLASTHSLFSILTLRNARAYPSARSIGFCVIWVCISSSSSSPKGERGGTIPKQQAIRLIYIYSAVRLPIESRESEFEPSRRPDARDLHREAQSPDSSSVSTSGILNPLGFMSARNAVPFELYLEFTRFHVGKEFRAL